VIDLVIEGTAVPWNSGMRWFVLPGDLCGGLKGDLRPAGILTVLGGNRCAALYVEVVCPAYPGVLSP